MNMKKKNLNSMIVAKKWAVDKVFIEDDVYKVGLSHPTEE
jgi:hypothetical protein